MPEPVKTNKFEPFFFINSARSYEQARVKFLLENNDARFLDQPQPADINALEGESFKYFAVGPSAALSLSGSTFEVTPIDYYNSQYDADDPDNSQKADLERVADILGVELDEQDLLLVSFLKEGSWALHRLGLPSEEIDRLRNRFLSLKRDGDLLKKVKNYYAPEKNAGIVKPEEADEYLILKEPWKESGEGIRWENDLRSVIDFLRFKSKQRHILFGIGSNWLIKLLKRQQIARV